MHNDLIRALGGANIVAELTGQKQPTVSNWGKRGVSWRYRPLVASLATERGIPLPEGFLRPDA